MITTQYCKLTAHNGATLMDVNSNFDGTSKEFAELLMQLVSMSTLHGKVAKISFPDEPSTEYAKPFNFYYNDFIEAKNLYQESQTPENKTKIMKWMPIYDALTSTDIQIVFVNDNDEPVENNAKLLEFIIHFFAAIKLDAVLPLNSTIGWRSRIGFGKYAKYTFKQILEERPDYLDWLKDKSDFSSRAVDAAHKFCVEHAQEIDEAVEREEHRKSVWKSYFGK